MRVTTNMLYNGAAQGLQNRLKDLKRVQEESSTGFRVLRPSDDPSASFMDLVMGASLSEVDSRVSNLKITSQRLVVAEDKINLFQNVFVGAYELSLNMANTYQDPADLRIQSQVVDSFYRDMLLESNTDVDGVPLFSGGRTASPFVESIPRASQVKWRAAGTGDMTDLNSSLYSVTNLDDTDPTFPGVPASIKVTFSGGTYSWEADGGAGNNVGASVGGVVDMGWGQLNLPADPVDGTTLFFELVPTYQGGTASRQIQLKGELTYSGNLTGEEIFMGTDSNNMDLFATMIGLRGALARGDHAEVGQYIDRLESGRSQLSELQAVTGLRSNRLQGVQTALENENSSIQEARALNREADMVDVLSALQKATQAMQVTTLTQRDVLDLSLIDFLR